MLKHILGLTLVLYPVAALCEKPPDLPKWEYDSLLVNCNDKATVKARGESGWEMVGFNVLLPPLEIAIVGQTTDAEKNIINTNVGNARRLLGKTKKVNLDDCTCAYVFKRPKVDATTK